MPQLLANQRRKAVSAAAETTGARSPPAPASRRHRNDIAIRTARSIAAKIVASTPAGKRTVAMPSTTSIIAGCWERDVDAAAGHREDASTITGAKAKPFAFASSLAGRAARRHQAAAEPSTHADASNRRYRLAALITLGNNPRSSVLWLNSDAGRLQ